MPSHRCLYLFACSLVVLLLCCGCGPQNDLAEDAAPGEDAATTDDAAADSDSSADGAPAKADSAADAAPPVTLQVVDRAAYDKVLAENKGKVIFVDFWATWCEPCKEQFPHTVEMYEKYKQAGLQAISVSLDDPEEDAAKQTAVAFLKENNAHFPNLLSEYGVGTEVFEKFEFDGGVPHYKLYDRTGKLRYSFSDQEQPGVEPTDKIEIRIKELVAENAD